MNEDILQQTKILSIDYPDFVSFSNAVFNPTDGLLVKTYPDLNTRVEFLKSDTYQEIREMLLDKAFVFINGKEREF